jgi:hypothetical protein
MNRNPRTGNRYELAAMPADLPGAAPPAERPSPRPGIDSWDNEGGRAAATTQDAANRRRKRKQTAVPHPVRADARSTPSPSESDAAELARLSQELAAIGCRVGQLGHTSETLVLLARITVLLVGRLSTVTERIARLERGQMPPVSA